jgi:hypothetical protein
VNVSYLIHVAKIRGQVWLIDGRQVTLKGIKKGRHARVIFGDGREYTIPVGDIAHVDEVPT